MSTYIRFWTTLLQVYCTLT